MKKWTIRKFAAHVGVEIVGKLVRHWEFEDSDGTRFYADDRAEKEDCVGFWISKGRVIIHCCADDSHYDSNNY